MDIEQLRKINEMSKTLQKHGIATSSEEGARLASQVHEEHLPQANSQTNSTEMISREMVEILVEREARKLRHKIDELEAKITEIANRPAPKPSYIEVQRQEAPAAQAQPQTNQQNTQATPPAKAPTQSSNSGTSDNSIKGRNPDEFDDGISVEKMFYYGSK